MVKEEKKLDTNFLIWIWPITLVFSVVIMLPLYILYGWLKLGNFIIDHTIAIGNE